MANIYFDKNKRAYDETYVQANDIEVIASVDAVEFSKFAGTDKWDIIDGEFVDLSTTPEYLQKQFLSQQTGVISEIKSKYSDAINYGVFALDDTYYANMAWYNTWSRVASLYQAQVDAEKAKAEAEAKASVSTDTETTTTPTEVTITDPTFGVRLYKKIDGVFYNYTVPVTFTQFKAMLQTLNSRQFYLYQPIRSQVALALSKATTQEELNYISVGLNIAFGDIVNEDTTYIADGK